MALHRADPAHLGQDHRHRLALDHAVHVQRLNIDRGGNFRPPLPARRRFAEQAADLAQLIADARPLQGLVSHQRGQALLFVQQAVTFGAQFDFLQLAQGAQAHVQDRLGLNLGQAHAAAPILGQQARLGFVMGADDLDHAVEVQIGDDIAFQHLQPGGDLAQTETRTTQQHVAAVPQKRLQNLLERADLGHPPVDQHVHVHAKANLQVRDPEQRRHQLRRIDSARLRFQHDADILGGFVAHIAQDRDLLGLDQLGQTLDQLGFLDLIGNFRDDDLP